MDQCLHFRELENPEYYLAAEVYSEDGVLLGKISIENRTWTEYKDISPYLIDALIALKIYDITGIQVLISVDWAGQLYVQFFLVRIPEEEVQ